MCAAYKGHAEVVQLLVAAGADMRVVDQVSAYLLVTVGIKLFTGE
jgi:hypothetical protein